MFTLYADSFEYVHAIMANLPVAPTGYHWACCIEAYTDNKYHIWLSKNAPLGY